jgi:hypothetical protein
VDERTVSGEPEPIELTVLACALDEEGMRRQGERYRRVAGDVLRRERVDGELRVELRDGFDRETLEKAIAVERECCPFFVIDLDCEKRTLTVSVEEEAHRPALDAIAEQLGV